MFEGFQLLLILIVLIASIPSLAGIVALVVSELIGAWILCIYCGNYLYGLPEGMQI